MKTRSFFNISLVGAGNIINAILGFIFLTAMARALSVNEFGKYALLTSFLVSTARIMDFGTNSLFVVQSIKGGNNTKAGFLAVKVVLFAVSAVIALILLSAFKFLVPSVLTLFLIGLIGYGINFTLFPLFQKEEKFHMLVVLNALPAAIKGSVGLSVLSGYFHPSLVQAFGIFSSSMLSSLLLYMFLSKDLKRLQFSFKDVFKTIKETSPAGISLLINESWMAISNTLIKVSKTFTDVGIFSLANKIANVFTLISFSIFTVLLPKSAAGKRERKKYDLVEMAILAACVLALSFVAVGISKTFIVIVFGEKYLDSLDLLGILIFASALTSIHTFMESYFYVEEKIKTLFMVTSSRLLAFLTLSLILIPKYSLQGLASAQLLAAVFTLAVVVTLIVTDS
ncbi:oligosaccharide flippase family protein [candidate division WWE3 bacterium]|nr:oligosaccharide flippase family protein [candidate division WWE3 bacterium]